jgi:hypothetical protein
MPRISVCYAVLLDQPGSPPPTLLRSSELQLLTSFIRRSSSYDAFRQLS